MPLIDPARCAANPVTGEMTGRTGHYEKRLSALSGLYEDEAALTAMIAASGDQVVYDVGEFRPSAASGDLIFGVTRMSPGKIGREYFLTRGHIHAKADRSEVYYGQKGYGLMQLESPEGETRIVEITPQTICYVPPFWIHRSVKIGPEDLVMMFCYSADSGQDYGIIERSGGMRHRVMATPDGGWELIDNPAYTHRSPKIINELFKTCHLSSEQGI